MAGNFSASTKLVRKEGEGGGFRGDDGSGTRKRVLWYGRPSHTTKDGNFLRFFFFSIIPFVHPQPPHQRFLYFFFFLQKAREGGGPGQHLLAPALLHQQPHRLANLARHVPDDPLSYRVGRGVHGVAPFQDRKGRRERRLRAALLLSSAAAAASASSFCFRVPRLGEGVSAPGGRAREPVVPELLRQGGATGDSFCFRSPSLAVVVFCRCRCGCGCFRGRPHPRRDNSVLRAVTSDAGVGAFFLLLLLFRGKLLLLLLSDWALGPLCARRRRRRRKRGRRKRRRRRRRRRCRGLRLRVPFSPQQQGATGSSSGGCHSTCCRRSKGLVPGRPPPPGSGDFGRRRRGHSSRSRRRAAARRRTRRS